LNLTSLAWVQRASLPILRRYDHCSLSLKGTLSSDSDSIYLIGGRNETNIMNDTWILRANSSFISASAVPTSVSGHSCTAISQYIYIFGGFNGTAASSSLLVYNAENNTWSQISTGINPTARFHHSAINNNNNLVIFGGEDGTSFFNDVWLFNTSSWEWVRIHGGTGFAPTPRTRHGASLMADGMVVWGGLNSSGIALDEFFFFIFNVDPSSSWIQLQGNQPQARFSHSTVASSTGITMYVAGGHSASFTFNDVWQLTAILSDVAGMSSGSPSTNIIFQTVLPDVVAFVMLIIFVGGIILLAYCYKRQGN